MIFDIEHFEEIDSTNTYLMNRAANCGPEILPEWHTVIARCQTAGRGRRGRSFVSPAGTGLYLSVLLRPKTSIEVSTRITTAAAVAACTAIEKCTGEKASIKWVNDIFVRSRKVCGILTEAVLSPGGENPDAVVCGIGFNLYEPAGGFADDIRDIAGAICENRIPDLENRMSTAFLEELYNIYTDPDDPDYVSEYKRRSFIIGQDINVIDGKGTRKAKAIDIDDECRLIVIYEDGTQEALSSGEVSVRKTDDQ